MNPLPSLLWVCLMTCWVSANAYYPSPYGQPYNAPPPSPYHVYSHYQYGPYSPPPSPYRYPQYVNFLQQSATIRHRAAAAQQLQVDQHQKLLEEQHLQMRMQQAQSQGEGGPEQYAPQSWTYQDVKSPPEWLIPKESQKPGLPVTKPPPVPQMIPPPPPLPSSPYLASNPLAESPAAAGNGAAQEGFGPPPPSYALSPLPASPASRWVPIQAFLPEHAYKFPAGDEQQ